MVFYARSDLLSSSEVALHFNFVLCKRTVTILMKLPLSSDHIDVQNQNHGMGWVGGDFKDHLVPNSVP